MTAAVRGSADNLILLCRDDHDDVDRAGSLDVTTIERLRELKRQHEAWIERLARLHLERGTVILRVVGSVDGAPAQITRDDALDAVIEDGRIPDFPLSLDRDGVELDLRRAVPRPDASAAEWSAAGS